MAERSRPKPRGRSAPVEHPPLPLARRILRALLLWGLVLGVLGLGALCAIYWWLVVLHPGEHLDRASILRVISQESPVYYADGTSKLGVFFSEEHRQYVPAAELPERFVQALVAAEDRTFFEHHGVSIRGVSRAMVQNLAAGRTVAGGSTLTQQTAKNLFERRGRTYKEKLRELANALRLERMYTKREILEFYSNQFYVNGNGRGLAIAARFFFDAETAELDLLQCVFLAGVVKSPNRYNPFVPDAERRGRAIAAGRERVAYVLGRMLEDGAIDAATHDELVARELPFQRGRFRFERSAVLDFVEQELNSEEFRRTLAAHGVVDPGRAGLRVTTTLDRAMQQGAVYALRHHLSDVGLWLASHEVSSLLLPPPTLHPAERSELIPKSFHVGAIAGVDEAAGIVRVDLGGVEGRLDADALTRIATALLRGKGKNTWVNAARADRLELVAALGAEVGRGISVSVRAVDDGGTLLLDWEPRVELEGAVIAIESGEVRAMSGGWANEDFNRAVAAKRQLGSIWKMLLFEAALQLGWLPTDALHNDRGVFPYQSTFYHPRPDHTGAPERVSLGWAATKSENLASVWLLDHLTDRLTQPQFRALAERVGWVPQAGEQEAWVRRVQAAGVLPTESKLREGLFAQVWAEQIAPDLLFEGREEDAELGRGLRFGLGFEDERAAVLADPALTSEERAIRLRTLDRSFLRIERLAVEFAEVRVRLLAKLDAGETLVDADLVGFAVRGAAGDSAPSLSWGERHDVSFSVVTAELFKALVDPPSGLWRDGGVEPTGETEADSVWDEADAAAAPNTPTPEPDRPGGRAPPPRAAPVLDQVDPGARERHLARVSGEEAPGRLQDLLGADRVRIEGTLTPALVQRARVAIEAARSALPVALDLYQFEQLALTRDFRLLVSLRYLVALAARSGVNSEIAPVMSLPLGSSDITLLDAALMVQSMLSGQTWRFYADALATTPGTEPVDLGPEPTGEARREDISIVREVRLADGTLIYATAREARPLHDPALSAELGAMMRSVVTHGTGRRAAAGAPLRSAKPDRDRELLRRGVVVPLLGKTGTTNSYKNSAFVGLVPGLGPASGRAPGSERLMFGAGTVVAVYVGFDDNREMRNGSVRLAGASGSLPAWIGAAEAVAAASDLGDRVDLVDLDFSGGGSLDLVWPPGTVAVPVDAVTGLPVGVAQPGLADGSEDEPVAWLRVREAGSQFAPVAGP